MRRPGPLLLLAAWLLAGCGTWADVADPASDAPPPRRVMARETPTPPSSYPAALASWRGPEAIAAWLEARFEYDTARALSLSESARAGGDRPVIHEPAAFFDRPSGICVDVARFGVETLRAIAPELEPRYLMIEFSPTVRAGQVLRRHWIATFRRDAGFYFFADSKRPGAVAGPYPSVEAFVAEYAAWRRRDVVAHRHLDSYRKTDRRQRNLSIVLPRSAVPGASR